jgi:hypothetical protein
MLKGMLGRHHQYFAVGFGPLNSDLDMRLKYRHKGGPYRNPASLE